MSDGIPVIIDPEYSRFIVQARRIGKEDGYAIAVHGSMTRDLDLVAIPWIKNCRKPIHLVTRIAFVTGTKLQANDPQEREHGRLAWSFLFDERFPENRFVDFSVMPPSLNPSDT